MKSNHQNEIKLFNRCKIQLALDEKLLMLFINAIHVHTSTTIYNDVHIHTERVKNCEERVIALTIVKKNEENMIEISFVKVRHGRACLRSTMTFHKKRNNSNYILVPCSHAKMAKKINSNACNPKLEVTFACIEYMVTQTETRFKRKHWLRFGTSFSMQL